MSRAIRCVTWAIFIVSLFGAPYATLKAIESWHVWRGEEITKAADKAHTEQQERIIAGYIGVQIYRRGVVDPREFDRHFFHLWNLYGDPRKGTMAQRFAAADAYLGTIAYRAYK